MKRNFKKIIGTTITCLLLFGTMCLNIFAYRADSDVEQNFSGEGATAYAYLFVDSLGNDAKKEYAKGYGETRVSTRTSNMKQLRVTYWFEKYGNEISKQSVYDKNYTDTSTMGWEKISQAAAADGFYAEHYIFYIDPATGETKHWYAETSEVGVFFP